MIRTYVQNAICVERCPDKDTEQNVIDNSSHPDVYAAWSNDINIHQSSSYGGEDKAEFFLRFGTRK